MKYIGSRYVPKFMGDYDSTTGYEALSVVDNGMGTSYISNKPVPAGTPLTNTDYWTVYGASSGAILDLQTRMTAAENDIVTKAQKRHIIIIGNSYVTLGCADKVRDAYDEATIYTLGGSGFVGYVREPRTYEYCIDQAIADSDLDKDSVTDILFVCAVGETRAYTEKGEVNFVTEFTTNLASIMTKINNNFNNCHNVMVTYAETRKTAVITTPSPDSYNALFSMHQLFRNHLPIYGYSYLGWSGFNTLFINSWVDSDNYHPTATGAQIIGQLILQSMYSNIIYKPIKERKQLVFNYGQSGTMYVNTDIFPDHVHINTEQGLFSANSAVTITANDELLDLENLTYPIPMLRSSHSIYSALVQTTTGVRYDIFSLVLLRNTDGIMTLVVNNNPTQTTSGNIPLFIEGLQSFDYFF
jgi:hypothetical protein